MKHLHKTTDLVPASFSAAKMARGNSPRAFEITSVKLRLPWKREITLKGERWLEGCLGRARQVKR